MSSILRALKKLENDPRHGPDNNPPLHPQFVPLADTESRQTVVRIIMMVIGGTIVCGLVVLAGWWFFAAKTQAPTGVLPDISAQRSEQTKTAAGGPKHPEPSESSGAVAEPAAQTLLPPKTTAHVPEPPPVKISSPLSPAMTPQAPTTGEEQTGTMASQVPAAPHPEMTAPAPPAENIATVARRPVEPVKTEEVEIPILNDPDMNLQAITWSKNPHKRLAIINNRILRQGEASDGYRIDTINQDDVVLSNGGEKWKLLFRIK